jgi:hypothetical protein
MGNRERTVNIRMARITGNIMIIAHAKIAATTAAIGAGIAEITGRTGKTYAKIASGIGKTSAKITSGTGKIVERAETRLRTWIASATGKINVGTLEITCGLEKCSQISTGWACKDPTRCSVLDGNGPPLNFRR